jgi:hypothetical protein
MHALLRLDAGLAQGALKHCTSSWGCVWHNGNTSRNRGTYWYHPATQRLLSDSRGGGELPHRACGKGRARLAETAASARLSHMRVASGQCVLVKFNLKALEVSGASEEGLGNP